MAFRETDIHTLKFNPFDKISKQWMLITAGDRTKSNTMTASWGGVGIMWGSGGNCLYPPAEIHERICRLERIFYPFFPGRRIPESTERAAACPEERWKINGRSGPPVLCGRRTIQRKQAAVEEAEMIFVCRKLYAQEMYPECFTEDEQMPSGIRSRIIILCILREIAKGAGK